MGAMFIFHRINVLIKELLSYQSKRKTGLCIPSYSTKTSTYLSIYLHSILSELKMIYGQYYMVYKCFMYNDAF